MSLTKATSWTDYYYEIVRHYFWRPQDIGRISLGRAGTSRRKAAPKSRPPGWGHWKGKLQTQEVPLTHMISLLLHLAPQALVDRVASTLLGRQISDLDLVMTAGGVLDSHIVQPDMILKNSNTLVFIEMKVDSRSSVDQLAKYAIAAHCIAQEEPGLKSFELVLLCREATHECAWAGSRSRDLSDERAVKAAAVSGIEGRPAMLKQVGVQRYLKRNGSAATHIVSRVNSMGLRLADYVALDSTLRTYATENKAVEALVGGIHHELLRRNLIPKTSADA